MHLLLIVHVLAWLVYYGWSFNEEGFICYWLRFASLLKYLELIIACPNDFIGSYIVIPSIGYCLGSLRVLVLRGNKLL